MDISTVRAVFTGGSFCRAQTLTRQDRGQVLQFVNIALPDIYQVHFSNTKENSGTAKTQIGGADGVAIPDEYIVPGSTIYAWVFIQHGESGRSCYMVEIPVAAKPTVTDEEPTPQQQSAFDDAIARINAAAEATEAAAAAFDEARFYIDEAGDLHVVRPRKEGE